MQLFSLNSHIFIIDSDNLDYAQCVHQCLLLILFRQVIVGRGFKVKLKNESVDILQDLNRDKNQELSSSAKDRVISNSAPVPQEHRTLLLDNHQM